VSTPSSIFSKEMGCPSPPNLHFIRYNKQHLIPSSPFSPIVLSYNKLIMFRCVNFDFINVWHDADESSQGFRGCDVTGQPIETHSEKLISTQRLTKGKCRSQYFFGCGSYFQEPQESLAGKYVPCAFPLCASWIQFTRVN